MPRDFFELDCDGETVTLEYTPDGKLLFHGWDMDTELAAQELGFSPSLCYWVWEDASQNKLDDTLARVAFDDNLPLVEALLWAGADPRHNNNLALRRAQHYHQQKVVVALFHRLEHG